MDTLNTRRSVSARLADEQGVALIIALLAMLLLTALGMALSVTTTTERMISSNYRDGVETMYAADAAVERVMQDVLTVPDWNRILDGTATSSFVDGAARRPHVAGRLLDEPRGSDCNGALREDRLHRRGH